MDWKNYTMNPMRSPSQYHHLPPVRPGVQRIFWTVISGIAVCLPQCVLGLGVRIPNQDAEAIARGNAFAATANNPSALYYNPAGISQLHGTEIQVGVLSYL